MKTATELVGFVFCLGAIIGVSVTLASEDWRGRQTAESEKQCKDDKQRVAYMVRFPGEPHSAEACLKIFTYRLQP